jgi:excisionase family DNA binding protein
VLGGSDSELRLVLLGLDALAERLEGARRAAPEQLGQLRSALRRVLRDQGGSPLGDLAEGEDTAAMPLLLTYAEVADQLRVSEPMVKRLVRDGRLPVVHVGRCARVRPEDAEAFVASLTEES